MTEKEIELAKETAAIAYMALEEFEEIGRN